MKVMVCTGPVAYVGRDAVRADIANLGAALADVDGPVEAFLPSTSPSGFGRNDYYSSEQDYLVAVAEAMREEYLAVVVGLPAPGGRPVADRDPDRRRPQRPHHQRRRAQERVEVLNHALRGIGEDRIRLHTCYGLNHGPRLNDIPLADVVPVMLQINAGAYSFEVANPRHQHEWRIWADVPLADGKILLPGLLGHATNYVEHPRADRRRDLPVRQPGRPGERHRQRRLRVLLRGHARSRGAPDHGVGQVRRARRGRRHRHQAPLELS